MRARLARLAVDVTPLRESPEYRRLWVGESVSFIGTQMSNVAVGIQVYAITGSSLAVGGLGLAILIPLVALGLVGGAIADAVERRRLALLTSGGLAVLAAALTAQAAAGLDSVPLLYALVAGQAALYGVDSPTRRTFPPRLLPPLQIPAATALSMVSMNVGTTLGPLLAGAVISWWGLTAAYAVDLLSFAVALVALAGLRPMPPEGGGTRAGVASVLEGFRFLATRRVLLMTFVVDVLAMVFGMPRALFPQLADEVFGGGAGTVGLLNSALAAGALLAALLSGPIGRVHRQGLGVLVSVALWGVAITAFGLADALWLALLMLALAGAADTVSAVYRTSILQVATPDEMRGRLNGVFIVVVAGGPRLGDVRSGGVADLASPEVSSVSGGLIVVGGVAALAAAMPRFARYDARDPAP